ncbi:MAG: NAD(P)-dependent oxidoreductase [Armatimonadetes bacterium]|nr:NAD(P)-dependent oxidoreductase [Armatimonadota bacterium]
MKRLGFVGLGVMGGPMAGHLIEAGHSVVVWNRTASKASVFADTGAEIADSLADLAEQCDVIFLCVGRSEDVEECIHAMTPSAKPGTIFVDHSTISPSVAAMLHRTLSEDGFRFIDAPITGGSMGAQSGKLTIFCGGDEATFNEVEPLMQAYGKTVAYVGPGGKGQMMKMANQIAVGGALIGLCESLAFAKRAGLDIAQTRELLSGGAAGSWAFENYGPKILDQDWTPGFSINNQVKDFGYCREVASEIGASIPMTELTECLLSELIKQGRGEETTAALFDLLARGENS